MEAKLMMLLINNGIMVVSLLLLYVDINSTCMMPMKKRWHVGRHSRSIIRIRKNSKKKEMEQSSLSSSVSMSTLLADNYITNMNKDFFNDTSFILPLSQYER